MPTPTLDPRQRIVLSEIAAVIRAEISAVRALPVQPAASGERERIAASLYYGMRELDRVLEEMP